MLRRKAFLLVLQLFVFTMLASAQKTDTISFGMNSRYSFYTTEKTGEMIIHIPSRYQSSWLSVKLKADGRELNSWKGPSGGRLLTVEFPLDMNPGTDKITGEIVSYGSAYSNEDAIEEYFKIKVKSELIKKRYKDFNPKNIYKIIIK